MRARWRGGLIGVYSLLLHVSRIDYTPAYPLSIPTCGVAGGQSYYTEKQSIYAGGYLVLVFDPDCCGETIE